MYDFSIGVIIDSFKMDTFNAISEAATLGVNGIQMYSTYGKNSPEHLTKGKRKELLDYVKSNGLVFSAICGDLGEGFSNAEKNPYLVNRSKEIMELALDLECNIVTTHIGVIPDNVHDDTYKIIQEACFELAQYADSLNAHFAVETGPEKAVTLKNFLDSLKSNGVAVNFDPANFVMVTGDDPVQAVYSLKNYIVHTHAKDGVKLLDVDPRIIYGDIESEISSGRAFEEKPLGKGNVDFYAYLSALDEIGYRGFLTIEHETGNNPSKDIEDGIIFLRNIIKQV